MDKQLLQLAYAARNAQLDKDDISAEICARFVSQSWHRRADIVLWYVNCRSEVRTLPALQQQLSDDKCIAVPYCTADDNGDKCLGLWHLQFIDELQLGMWNILEPVRERWWEPAKQVKPEALGVVMVPGVAFDRLGGRVGNGAGYYDRLLQKVHPDAILAGVGYYSQLFPSVEMQRHDVYMDFVITEQAIVTGRRV